MLYASLAISLFSAFLAMLGKQWLSAYASTDMRGTAIERSQNRQRKLDGIVTWHFEYMMGSLLLMLQVALLMLGCALSRYLWDVDATVASVVLSITSFGVLFYLFTIIAGAASVSCPYQSPGSYALHSASLAVASALAYTSRHSKTVRMLQVKAQWSEPWWSRNNVMAFLKRVPCKIPSTLVVDTYHLGQGLVHHLVTLACQVHTWLLGIPSTQEFKSDQQIASLDLQCISWTLQTLPDKAVQLSTLEPLSTMAVFTGFNPSLVVDCLNILIGCVGVANGAVVVVQGSEQLATVSAACLLHTLSYLLVVEPMSDIFRDACQHYSMVFPPNANFKGLPFCHTLGAIHRVFYSDWNHQWFNWDDYKPFSHRHDIFAHALAELAFSECQRRVHDKKVPGWILRFVLHCLSLDPLPPTTVVIDCLSIIAIDLGCDISSIRITILDENRAQVNQVSALILQELETMIKAADPAPICTRHRAITTFFLYAARWEQNDQHRMINAFLHTARASGRQGFMWHHIRQPLITLLNQDCSVSSKQAIILALPHLPWWNPAIDGHFIQLWAATTWAVPYTDDIGQSVVDTLLLIASQESLKPHIPSDMWSWLSKCSYLPSSSARHSQGTKQDVVQTVRKLGDIEILKSYLLLVWSEWDYLYQDGLEEMCVLIREDFSGIGMEGHRKNLLQRLNYILGQLDSGLGSVQQNEQGLSEENIQSMKEQYGQLREVLLEMDTEAFKC